MLSPPKPLDENQPNLECELLTCMGRGEGSKGQISFNFNYKVNLKDFIPNFVCVLTNGRYKTYQTGFSFCRLGHAPGVGLWGAGWPGGKKNSNMVMWIIKSTG